MDLYESILFGQFSGGQLFIHYSTSLLCCLIEFRVFRLSCRRNLLGVCGLFQPQYGTADGSRFVCFLTGQRPYIFHQCLHSEFLFYFLASQHLVICDFSSHGRRVIFREPHFGSSTISGCLLYTSPSPRDRQKTRMPSSA